MTAIGRDRLTGAILLAFSAVWIYGVLQLIPDVAGAPTSPRTFPLAMGIALAVLAALLLLGTLVADAGAPAPVSPGDGRVEVRAVASTFVFLVAYIALLTKIGFILATVVVVTGFLWIVLKKRSWRLLVGMPIGLAFGIWLALGKLMGVYLPRGEWINLF